MNTYWCDQLEQSFDITDVPDGALLSILRDFSAPVILHHELSAEQQALCLQSDSTHLTAGKQVRNY